MDPKSESIFCFTSTGSKVRKAEKIEPNGTITECYRAYFDPQGNLLRDVAGGIERRVTGDTIFIYENGEYKYKS